MLLHRALLATPIGPMLALASDDGLCALEFDGPARHERLAARLAPRALSARPMARIRWASSCRATV